jgi:hypothetical protein
MSDCLQMSPDLIEATNKCITLYRPWLPSYGAGCPGNAPGRTASTLLVSVCGTVSSVPSISFRGDSNARDLAASFCAASSSILGADKHAR